MNKVSGRDGFFLDGFTIMMYLGIDVSKAKLHACLLHQQDKGKTQVVENNPPGIALLLVWAARHGAPAAQLHAVMTVCLSCGSTVTTVKANPSGTGPDAVKTGAGATARTDPVDE